MKTPVVSLILATYNSSKFLEEFFDSLKKQTFKNYELIIIDDCSQDDTREFLRKKGYKFIENKKRIGCTKTLNKAIKISKGDFIFRLDHDIVYGPDCIKEMVKTLTSSKNIGIAGSRSYYYKEKNKIRSFGVNLNLITSKAQVIGRDKIDNHQFDSIKEIGSIGGGNMMIKKEVFDKIGLYSEDYFLYYSDLDFCYKAKNEGYKTVLSKAKAWHKKQEKDTLNTNQSIYLLRDRLTFMRRNSNNYYLFLIIFLFFYIPYNILINPRFVKVFFKAFFDKKEMF